MVSKKSVEKQLKKIGFKTNGWGRGEINELPNIILPDEEIYECVNGVYDGGFALLVATDIRVLLIDQKPLNYLTVEDLRFDMISEMDYSHRLFGARISISAGEKNLKFLSYNQPRLRKLIGHVQHCMAEAKKKQNTHAEGQVQHLEKLNEQLQEYLLAQQKQQTKLQEQLSQVVQGGQFNQDISLEQIKPGSELSDYLFAQSLLAQHQAQNDGQGDKAAQDDSQPAARNERTETDKLAKGMAMSAHTETPDSRPTQANIDDELYRQGLQEVFGKYTAAAEPSTAKTTGEGVHKSLPQKALEINPITIAYSKLPMVLRNRRIGRPSLGAASINPEAIAAAGQAQQTANQPNGA